MIVRYFIAMVICFFGFVLEGQTRFHWPDSRVAVEKYDQWERCLAVATRTEDSIGNRTDVLRDTLPYNAIMRELHKGRDGVVVSSVRKCMSSVPHVRDMKDIPFTLQEVYLVINEDDKAKDAVNQKVRRIPSDSSYKVAATIDSAIRVFNNAIPARSEISLEFYDMLWELRSDIPSIILVRSLTGITNAAWNNYDATEIYHQTVSRVLELVKFIPDDEWEEQAGLEGSILYMSSLLRTRNDELLKALSVSTAAYNDLFRELFQRDVGREDRSQGLLNQAADEESARIHGDYWFPSHVSGEFPIRNRVTYYMPIATSSLFSGGLMVRAAGLRRLKAKFPELDIVITVQTSGSFLDLEPPDPETEAGYLHSYLKGFLKMPGVIAVTNTSFWRLPGYDRRRINEQTLNQINNVREGIIDKEGNVVSLAGQGRNLEDTLEKIIEVLINRRYDANQ